MPIVLAPDTTVTVEPPVTPVIRVSMPPSPAVSIEPPNTPTTSPAAPPDPTVTVVPVVGPPGPAGPPGVAGAGTYYTHTQTIPQSVWTVTHNFGRYPIAWSLYDTTNRLCDEYEVENTDVNTSRISMDTPTAGVIRLM